MRTDAQAASRPLSVQTSGLIQSPETELEANDVKVWNEIWDCLFTTHYLAFYEELCAEHSIKVWKRFDTGSRGFQLLTSGGSAIAGWALWNQDGFRWVWAVLVGISAVALVVHGMLNISEKIKEDTLIYSKFKHIRLQCERLRRHMKIGAYERLSDYKREYIDLTKEFELASASRTPDFLLWKSTELKIQGELNRIILNHEQ